MKFIQKKFRRGARSVRRYVARKSPPWMHRRFGPWFDYFDMLILDHGILRVIYPNKHKVAQNVWRASQPTPQQIRGYAKKGVRTIVNLRGERECGGYRLEEKSCKKHGIQLINLTISSRHPPTRERIHEVKQLFESIEYPFMMHCKSGADRAGFASVLYMLFKEKAPIEVAQKQLSLKYGHIRQAETGVLDHIFDSYTESKESQDISFLEWVDTIYEPSMIKHSFESSAWANRFVNLVLQRE
ncbi:MAG: tyrosine-protein phosphatase [Pseudomonadota bacterium]